MYCSTSAAPVPLPVIAWRETKSPFAVALAITGDSLGDLLGDLLEGAPLATSFFAGALELTGALETDDFAEEDADFALDVEAEVFDADFFDAVAFAIVLGLQW
jgi:hypothetical protein